MKKTVGYIVGVFALAAAVTATLAYLFEETVFKNEEEDEDDKEE